MKTFLFGFLKFIGCILSITLSLFYFIILLAFSLIIIVKKIVPVSFFATNFNITNIYDINLNVFYQNSFILYFLIVIIILFFLIALFRFKIYCPLSWMGFPTLFVGAMLIFISINFFVVTSNVPTNILIIIQEYENILLKSMLKIGIIEAVIGTGLVIWYSYIRITKLKLETQNSISENTDNKKESVINAN